ncbi:IS1 family transposase [Saccharicrinis aurantiacus]|uniref:IS1 family transposase n=1 Tax=Saccharicrinis aurantiacus TaxID=1849719 RepID=UPI002493A88D|nr:IS1 family transposase [Saccharicrinis aurantiacus]
MVLSSPSCIKSVGGIKICNYCSGTLIKHGHSTNRKSRYKCTKCNKTQVESYSNNACSESINNNLVKLLKEGVGIRGLSRLLQISTNTVINRIKSIAKQAHEPMLAIGKKYEVDELCTFVQNKENRMWVTIAIRCDTRQVVRFSVGKRTKATLSRVTDSLLISKATTIFTDGLKQYKTLIDKSVHSTKLRSTNHIERLNLTLRTHLKRLCRRSICYSKQRVMLSSVLKIYFWV